MHFFHTSMYNTKILLRTISFAITTVLITCELYLLIPIERFLSCSMIAECFQCSVSKSLLDYCKNSITYSIIVNSKIVLKEKHQLRIHFCEQLEFIVNQHKQGYSSTNDGNTVQGLFENLKISQLFTGVGECSIGRFRVILQVISCCFEMHSEKFWEFSLNITRNLLRFKYGFT